MHASQREFEPATLDLITPDHYVRHGYPHPEWTWLRQHDPVFWYDRPEVDPFWAITKHGDIIWIGKQPDLFLNAPRLAVFTLDLPPGRYRLTALSERSSPVAIEISSTPGASTAQEITLDESTWRFVQHTNKFGKDYPTAAYKR